MDKKLLNVVRYGSMIQMTVSFIFWMWALINIVSGRASFDLGVVTFIFPFIAGLSGYLSVSLQRSIFVNLYLILTIFGHAIVTYNYCDGAGYFSKEGDKKLVAYTAIFAGIWFTSLTLYGRLAYEWRNIYNQTTI